MRIGCVKEIKNNEFRVGMTPDNVKNYVKAGHEVYIERDAGVGSGFTTEQYEKAGARILDQAKDVWDKYRGSIPHGRSHTLLSTAPLP